MAYPGPCAHNPEHGQAQRGDDYCAACRRLLNSRRVSGRRGAGVVATAPREAVQELPSAALEAPPRAGPTAGELRLQAFHRGRSVDAGAGEEPGASLPPPVSPPAQQGPEIAREAVDDALEMLEHPAPEVQEAALAYLQAERIAAQEWARNLDAPRRPAPPRRGGGRAGGSGG